MAESFIPLTTSNLGGSISSITSAIDTNFSNLHTLLTDVLSRSAVSPNTLTATLDMNSNRIINLPPAGSLNDPVRLGDLTSGVGATGPQGATGPAGPLGVVGGLLNLNQDPATTDLISSKNANTIVTSFDKIQNPTTTLTSLLNLSLTTFGGGVKPTGAFNTLNCICNINAQTGNINGAYVSGTFVAQGTINDGGTVATPSGSIFGLNPNVRLVSTATNWLQLVGQEIDISCGSGCSVSDIIGCQLVETSNSIVGGTRSNLGISLNNALGAVGWDVGICFGAYSGYNPMTSTGTLIGTMQHGVSLGYGVAGSMGTVTYGVDLTGYTFSGAPFLAQLQTPASSSATGKTGSICWDASYVYVCTATNTWKRSALSTF